MCERNTRMYNTKVPSCSVFCFSLFFDLYTIYQLSSFPLFSYPFLFVYRVCIRERFFIPFDALCILLLVALFCTFNSVYLCKIYVVCMRASVYASACVCEYLDFNLLCRCSCQKLLTTHPKNLCYKKRRTKTKTGQKKK